TTLLPVQAEDRVPHAREELVAVRNAQPVGGDRRADLDPDRARAWAEALRRKAFARAVDGDGNDGRARLQGDHERALLEGEDPPVGRASSLGEGDDAGSLAEELPGLLHAGDRLREIGRAHV